MIAVSLKASIQEVKARMKNIVKHPVKSAISAIGGFCIVRKFRSIAIGWMAIGMTEKIQNPRTKVVAMVSAFTVSAVIIENFAELAVILTAMEFAKLVNEFQSNVKRRIAELRPGDLSVIYCEAAV